MTENKENQTKNRKKPKKKKKSKALKVTLITILVLGLFFIVAAAGMGFAMIKTAPELDINKIVASSQPSVIYDDKGKIMDTIITDKKRILVKYGDMPKNLINAFVSVEDERFFEHNGIDLKRIAGIFLINIKSIVTGKQNLQGGSTITQQLLKNTVFDTDTKNLDSTSIFKRKVSRKVQEWYLAPKLEKLIGKKAILESYLNTIYLGGRAIGVEAASQQYFGKNVKDLSLVQCAFLAGLTRSPSVYYPYSITSRKDPSKYKNRTKTVLEKMRDNNAISEAEYKKAIDELNIPSKQVTKDEKLATLGNGVLGKATSSKDKYNFEWFSRPVVTEVKRDLKEKYKYTDEEVENLITNGNLKIYSTMDRELQNYTQKVLDDGHLRTSSRKNDKGIIEPQMSATFADYHTGQIKVMVGGRGEQPALSYNRAYDAKIPVGSSVKPLTVYAPAIDTKIATAATVMEDEPLSDAFGRKYNGGKPWNPKNSPNRFSGPINMRRAIKDSVNIYSIKMEDKIGLQVGSTYGAKFGLTLDNVDKNSMSALALGELSHGSNTYGMASAYGVFGNNGLYTTPRLYTKVVDSHGKVLLEPKVSTRQVLSPQASYIMYDMLKEPVRSGTATRLKLGYNSSIPVAGKTGSTTGSKHLWFCGLTPYYSGAVWIDNKHGQRIYSSDAALIFGKIMNRAVQNLPTKDIPAPSGITSIAVDRLSGLLPSGLSYLNPTGDSVYTELFINGTEPTEHTTILPQQKIDDSSEKPATPENKPNDNKNNEEHKKPGDADKNKPKDDDKATDDNNDHKGNDDNDRDNESDNDKHDNDRPDHNKPDDNDNEPADTPGGHDHHPRKNT